MKRLLVAAGALVVVVAGLWLVWRGRTAVGPAGAAATATASYGDLRPRVVAGGAIQTAHTVTLVADAAGTLTLDVSVGQHVQAGELVAAIDDHGAASEHVAAAQAALASAELQLQQLETPGTFVTDAEITNAQLAVSQAQAGVNLAESRLNQQQAALAAAQSAMVLTAPVAGTVQYVTATPGQAVGPGTPLTAVVAPGSPLLVQAQIPQTGYAGSVGDRADVVVNAVGRTFAGTVTAIQNGNPNALGSSTSSMPGRPATPFGPLPPPSGGGSVAVTVTLPPDAALAGLKDGMTALVTVDGQTQSGQGTGVVQYQNDWALSPQVAGNVAQVLVQPGDSVAAGATLLRLDSPALESNLIEAQAGVDQGRAALAEARAAAAEAQAHLDQLQNPATAPTSQIAAQKALVAQAQAAVSVAENAAARLDVRSPFAAVIAATPVTTGNEVGPGTPVAAVIDPGSMQAMVQVPEQAVGFIAVGQKASVDVAALGLMDLPATVAEVSPEGHLLGGTTVHDVTLALGRPSGLAAGMAATASIAVPPVHHVLLIPQAAVAEDGSGKTTVEIATAAAIRVQAVATGLTDGTRVQITQGLKSGDLVVLPGSFQ